MKSLQELEADRLLSSPQALRTKIEAATDKAAVARTMRKAIRCLPFLTVLDAGGGPALISLAHVRPVGWTPRCEACPPTSTWPEGYLLTPRTGLVASWWRAGRRLAASGAVI